MARFAGGVGQFLKNALIPAGKNNTERLINGAMTYGPDLAFAGFSGAMAPGGGFDAGIALEDLGISLAGSVGSGVLSRMAGKRFFPNNPEAQGRLQMVGDLALTTPLQMFAPRPVLNAAIEREIQGQQAQQNFQQQVDQRQSEEQLLQALLTTGALAMPPGLAMNPGTLLV